MICASDTIVVTQLSGKAEPNTRILIAVMLRPPQWETIELLRLEEEPRSKGERQGEEKVTYPDHSTRSGARSDGLLWPRSEGGER